MNVRLKTALLLLVVFLSLSACRFLGASPAEEQATPEAVSELTFDGFMSELKKAGIPVTQQGEVSQPFFPVDGKVILLEEAEVQVFEFPDAEASRMAVESVAPDGGAVGTTMVSWLATPHFFRTDNLIVLYVGDDPAVVKRIEAVMGPQFAGG